MPKPSPLLAVKRLSIYFGSQAIVRDVSFKINQGECVALVGESGSGKTLTALAINQCLPHQAHMDQETCIHLNGQAIHDETEAHWQKIRGGQIGYIRQDALSAFNPVKRIGQQIDEALKLHTALSRQARYQRALSLFQEVGLKQPARCYDAYPHQLSGGMLQRALVACVLAPKPKLLIADEPTTALDAGLQRQLLTLLRQLQKDHHMGMLFITHQLSLLNYIADDVHIMQKGQIIEQTSPTAFATQPTHPYSQILFKASQAPKNFLTHSPSTKQLAHIDGLSVHRGDGPKKRTIIDDITFSLHQGRTTALLGESGAGKTTLAETLLGMHPWSTGHVHWKNKPRVKGHQYPHQQQYVFQDPWSALNPKWTVRQSLDEAIRYAKSDYDVEKLLQEVGLDANMADRHPHRFSGGQRQRICLARMMAFVPELVILDEPTSALDVSVQHHVLELLQTLQNKHQLSYLLITHDLHVVKALSHYVMVYIKADVLNMDLVRKC